MKITIQTIKYRLEENIFDLSQEENALNSKLLMERSIVLNKFDSENSVSRISTYIKEISEVENMHSLGILIGKKIAFELVLKQLENIGKSVKNSVF